MEQLHFNLFLYLFIYLFSLPSKANSRHFSSQNISAKQHCPSVCTVCVCVCVGGGGVFVHMCIFCINVLYYCKAFRAFKDLSTLCVSWFVFLIYIFADNISISMYFMCYTMLVRRFEPQGRHLTNSRYYYYCSDYNSVLE